MYIGTIKKERQLIPGDYSEIADNYVSDVRFTNLPIVGENFVCPSQMHTSIVQSIEHISDAEIKFTTMNSVYSLEFNVKK